MAQITSAEQSLDHLRDAVFVVRCGRLVRGILHEGSSAGHGDTTNGERIGKVSKVVAGSTTQDTVYTVDGSILLRTNTTEGSSLFVGDTVLT